MTTFAVDVNTELPDCAILEVDHRFAVAIHRTLSGLMLRVYPRTEGELWDDPFVTFEVDESEISALEQKMSP